MLVAQSCPTLATTWTVTCQAPLSMEFLRQEYWSGLLGPPPGGLPNPGIQPGSPALQAGSLPSEPPGKPLCLLRSLSGPGFLRLPNQASQTGGFCLSPGEWKSGVGGRCQQGCSLLGLQEGLSLTSASFSTSAPGVLGLWAHRPSPCAHAAFSPRASLRPDPPFTKTPVTSD